MQSTKDYKLVYSGGHQNYIKLEMYTDNNWAGNKETKRSTTKYVALLNGTAMSWAFKRQTSVAQSLCKAKYIATSGAVKETV